MFVSQLHALKIVKIACVHTTCADERKKHGPQPSCQLLLFMSTAPSPANTSCCLTYPLPAPRNDVAVCSLTLDLQEAVKPLSACHGGLGAALFVFWKRIFQKSSPARGSVGFPRPKLYERRDEQMSSGQAAGLESASMNLGCRKSRGAWSSRVTRQLIFFLFPIDYNLVHTEVLRSLFHVGKIQVFRHHQMTILTFLS